MPELKLPQLPDRTLVKIAINVSPDLHAGLLEYARIYEVTYGRPETVTDLIPAMLSTFLQSDRAFARERQVQSSRAGGRS